MLLLTLMDPISGPRAGCPPVMCITTINFRKNCRSWVKYARFCASFHWYGPLAVFLNIFHSGEPFCARCNKNSYPTSVWALFWVWLMKLYSVRRNSWLHAMLSTMLLKSMAGTAAPNVNLCNDSCNSLVKILLIVRILLNCTGLPW